MYDRRCRFAGTSIVVFGLALAIGAAVGCEVKPLVPAGVSNNGAAAGEPNPNDPFGSCLVDQHAFGWYDCSTGDTTCTGWGSTSCGSGGSCTSTYHAICDHTCQTDADCPIPATGNVRPICHPYVHSCQLPCDGNTTCPSGLACQSTADWGLRDVNGTRIPPPFQCMQTLTVTNSDAGLP